MTLLITQDIHGPRVFICTDCGEPTRCERDDPFQPSLCEMCLWLADRPQLPPETRARLRGQRSA